MLFAPRHASEISVKAHTTRGEGSPAGARVRRAGRRAARTRTRGVPSRFSLRVHPNAPDCAVRLSSEAASQPWPSMQTRHPNPSPGRYVSNGTWCALNPYSSKKFWWVRRKSPTLSPGLATNASMLEGKLRLE